MSEQPQIAYLTSAYGRPSDTFIRNEVDQLRSLGAVVRTFSIRKPSVDDSTSTELKAHREDTEYLLEVNPLRLLAVGLGALLAGPFTAVRTARLAWRSRQPGVRGLALQIVYFLEAAYLASRLRKLKTQLIHNHIAENSATIAMLAAHLAGIPFSMTVHGPGIFFHPERWALGLKVQQSAFTVCITHFCKSQCMIFAPPTAWRRLRVLFCAVGPQFVDEPPPPIDSTPTRRAVLVGRLCPEKGHLTVLEALRRVIAEGVHLSVDYVGDGPFRNDLEEKIRELDLSDHVRLLGWRSSEEVREIMLASDFLLMPSFAEGLPIAIMESLAMRRPVLTTAIAGIPELVEDRVCGRVVTAGSVDELSEAMVEMATTSPESLRQMGEEGRRLVMQNHHPAEQAQRLLELVRSAIVGDKTLASQPAETPVDTPRAETLQAAAG